MQLFVFKHRFLIFAAVCFSLTTSAMAHSGEIGIPLVAKKIDIGVMLKWTTEKENGADFFLLEKSLDGKDFEVITEVVPTGTDNNGSDYSFIDLFPEEETTYYRLKMVYKDGRATAYQPVQAINIPKTHFLISKMNTSTPTNELSVNLEMFISGALVYQLSALDGMIVENGIKRVAEGYNDLNFSLDGWQDGVYILTMEMSGDQKSLTIQKIGNTTLQVSNN